MKIVFVHGWGFGPSVWDGMTALLDGHEHITPNLGFIGRANKPITIPDDAVLVGHSLGVMWLLSHLPARVRGFISISGFDCFAAHVPARDIAGMKCNLSHNLQAQMTGFYRACGMDDVPPADEFNGTQLSAGLEWLDTWDERASLSSLTCPVMALAAEDDKIVPPSMTHAIWDDYDLRMTEAGGHILPMTQAAWCAGQVKGFIDAL